ncbi:hypothetical protein WT83_19135 [Burkholderia territorii]|uniref:Uncharacterized protein n=1 Tax=Burkholderia territorii TaxID=1503055 RepID=A0A108EKL5_9BURK|nr:hypothetical protein WT83_19135 [Burkholderia territorii]
MKPASPARSASRGADDAESSRDLVYGPNDRPAPMVAFVAALQHLLAIIVPIVTPGLLICQALGIRHIEPRYDPYRVDVALSSINGRTK